MKKKYTYKNGVVIIEKPTKKQLENIKNSTKIFMQQILKHRRA